MKSYRTTMTSDIREMRRLAAEGYSMNRAAREIGCTWKVVAHYQRSLGLGFKPRRPRRPPVPDAELRAALVKLRRTLIPLQIRVVLP